MVEERPPRAFAVVQRGREDVFQRLTRQFAGELEVLWDRRQQERRWTVSPIPRERRGVRDRRRPVAWMTWLGFRIVRGPGTAGGQPSPG